MTIDITKLEVLAKAASQGCWNQDGFEVQNDDINNYRVARCNWLADAKFIAAASPVEVLALIDIGKQQAQQFKEWQASHHANYVAVAEERDRLRAEVAGLKTGYEAYERVNAELKAENDALRKDAERYDWLKINSSVMLKKTATYTTGLGRINTIYPAGSELDLCLDAAMGKGEQS